MIFFWQDTILEEDRRALSYEVLQGGSAITTENSAICHSWYLEFEYLLYLRLFPGVMDIKSECLFHNVIFDFDALSKIYCLLRVRHENVSVSASRAAYFRWLSCLIVSFDNILQCVENQSDQNQRSHYCFRNFH